MDDLISICIPSYKRPHLLAEAIQSCFANDYRPLEILIGDDSPVDSNKSVVNCIQPPIGINIDYRRNEPGLGQAGNVNSLFDAAQGDRLILLHDDDRLLPAAIDTMAGVWQTDERFLAVFGKQRIVDNSGGSLPKATDMFNTGFFRTSDRAGLQPSAVTAGLLAMFPNNGYLIRTSAARCVRYRDYSICGDACDYDFGVRLACAFPQGKFYFVDEFTVDYRMTDISVSRDAMNDSYAYPLLVNLSVETQDQPALEFALQRRAPTAASQLAHRGQRRAALRVFLSPHFMIPRWSPRGLYYFATILLPGLYSVRRKIRLMDGVLPREEEQPPHGSTL